MHLQRLLTIQAQLSDRGKESKRQRGSVTVYLALILVLIMALLFSMLEAARSVAARAYSEISTTAAAESLMGYYYGPLYDKYHIFAIDSGFGTAIKRPHMLDNILEEYVSDGLWGIRCKSIGTDNLMPLLSYDQHEFIRQAVQYEVTRAPLDLVEYLLDSLDILSKQQAATNLLAEKIEVEEELAELDIYTLKLMKTVDGVDGGVSRIRKKGTGYKIVSTFAKQLFILPLNQFNTGINNVSIYQKLSGLYVNPVDYATSICQTAESYKTVIEEILWLEEYIEEIKQINIVENADMTDEEKQQIRLENEKRIRLLEELEANLLDYKEQKKELKKTLSNQLTSLLKLTRSVAEKMLDGEKEAQDAIRLQEKLKPKVEEYEKLVNKAEGFIGDEVMRALQDSIHIMKGYVGITVGSEITDYKSIEATLSFDEVILKQIAGSGLFYVPSEDPMAIASWIESFKGIRDQYKALSYSGLNFDYSKFKSGTNIDEKIITTVGNRLSEGIINLVLYGEEEISDRELNSDILPSQWNYGETSVNKGSSGIIGEERTPKVIKNIGNGAVKDIIQELSQGIDIVKNKLLLTLYYCQHFNCCAEKTQQSHTFLSYELEYILNGNMSEKIDLAETLAEVFAIRMLPNVIYVMTDSTLGAEATEVAGTLLGFTGLPFLVSAMKYLLLVSLAMEQSVIDTSVLARGKKVGITASKESFTISIGDLLLFSGSFVKEKAEQSKEPSLGLTYQNIISLFLLVKSKERTASKSLDLIQENIRYAYNEDFLLNNSIVGFDVKANYVGELIWLPNKLLKEYTISKKIGFKY